MHTYEIKTGRWSFNGHSLCFGYSGHDEAKNAPSMIAVSGIGPIPTGMWKIVGPPFDTASHGPYVLALRPDDHTDTYGRYGFMIHGDSKRSPGAASLGCIILPRWAREAVWNSGDYELLVVAGESDRQEA